MIVPLAYGNIILETLGNLFMYKEFKKYNIAGNLRKSWE